MTTPGTVTFDVHTRQPYWRELVQDRKELWVFRDCPDLLQLAPDIQQQLQQLEEIALPVVTDVRLTGLTPLQPHMEVVLKTDRWGTHYGWLQWDGQRWQYSDPLGPQSPWAAAVLDSWPRPPQHFPE
jgi:hypothetical protein